MTRIYRHYEQAIELTGVRSERAVEYETIAAFRTGHKVLHSRDLGRQQSQHHVLDDGSVEGIHYIGSTGIVRVVGASAVRHHRDFVLLILKLLL